VRSVVGVAGVEVRADPEYSLCDQLPFLNDDDDDGASCRDIHVELRASEHSMTE
jgi:hypothetical protein